MNERERTREDKAEVTNSRGGVRGGIRGGTGGGIEGGGGGGSGGGGRFTAVGDDGGGAWR